MPKQSAFTAEQNETIIRMRQLGCSWKAIAAALPHAGWNAIRDHAYRNNLIPRAPSKSFGAAALSHAQAMQLDPPAPAFDHGHNVMPAFHAVSWGAIWAGLATRP